MNYFTCHIEPRFCETDALGHVNNTALPIWFEHARTPFFRLFNAELKLDTWNLILKKIDVDFIAQIFLGEPVEVRSYLNHIGSSSFVVVHEAWQAGNLVAKGHAVMVHFDYQEQAKAAIPDDVRASLEAYLHDA